MEAPHPVMAPASRGIDARCLRPPSDTEVSSRMARSSKSGVVINIVRGFCMALADSVPGVSGGTIAFILGFYDRFIGSIDDLFHGNHDQRMAALRFLVKIGIGWVCGFILAALILSSLFDTYIYAVSSLFMGFIVFAIPIVVSEERECLKGRPIGILFIAIGICIVVAITLLNPASGEGVSVAVEDLTPGLVAYVFVAGMVVISAMVLPGISGSTLLLIFGLYIPVMGAVRAVLGLDFSYLPVLLVFIVGVLCGALIFVRLIRMCLEHFRTQTIYLILGMMVGSLFAITQGPLTLDDPQPAMTLQTFNILFFVIGCAVVAGLQVMKMHLQDPDEQPVAAVAAGGGSEGGEPADAALSYDDAADDVPSPGAGSGDGVEPPAADAGSKTSRQGGPPDDGPRHLRR